jgi:hypothetical protein
MNHEGHEGHEARLGKNPKTFSSLLHFFIVAQTELHREGVKQ